MVLDYIYNNLDADLSLEKIAEVACFSTFHWHRIYQCITNENIANTIRRLRLQRAARALAETETSVPRIAQRAGYKHPDSFVRKFSQDFGLSPTEYRKQSLLQSQRAAELPSILESMYHPQLEPMPALELAALEHRGDYMTMGAAFTRLRLLGESQHFLTEESRAIGIFYSDPTVVKVNELRSKACFTFNTDKRPGPDVEHISLRPQTYATILHQGPYHELDPVYRWLYGYWLLDSGFEPADLPVIEEYLNSPRFVEPRDLLTKIYLPIKKE
jgi:AraC family transcriptional regulator